MIEIPESYVLSGQITDAFAGRRIESVVANASPHGFAWFHGEPETYPALLEGSTIRRGAWAGGQVIIETDGPRLRFNDGTNLRLLAPGAKRPPKHQLLLELDDGSALVVSIQMYGGIMAFPKDFVDTNPYHIVAEEKPSPLTDAFDEAYFQALVAANSPTLSAKAFLATEQRIPGFGNGVLQDILFLSGIHPMRPMRTLDDAQLADLYTTLKQTLRKMADEGGRDVEKDLYGKPGGYRTLLSRKTYTYPCPRCGGPIERKAYLGGNVYFCPVCQPKAWIGK